MQWSAHIPTGFHVPRRTLEIASVLQNVAYGALTLYSRPSQTSRLFISNHISRSEPHPKVVWAVPLSLAATDGID